jgi:hypothetical protein
MRSKERNTCQFLQDTDYFWITCYERQLEGWALLDYWSSRGQPSHIKGGRPP